MLALLVAAIIDQPVEASRIEICRDVEQILRANPDIPLDQQEAIISRCQAWSVRR
jgi:hypothetical protein